MNLKKSRFPSTASMLLVLVAFAALFMAWHSPLIGTPTTEAALFLGTFLAPLTLLAGACRSAFRNPRGFQNDVFQEGIWVFGTTLFYLGALYVHSFSLKSCSPSAGIFPFLVLLVPQLFLNLVTGVWIGRIVGKVKLAVAASLIFWCGYMAIQISLWWMNPSLRFFEPYWLMIAGDLLQGQSLDSAIIAYRLSSLLYGLALLSLGVYWKRHATQFWVVFFLASSAIVVQFKSSSLISPAFSERRQAYPDLITQGPLALHTNLESVGHDQAKAILQEGTLWLERLKERTGIEIHHTIDIWLYSSQESMAHFTGAKNVHFTLPSHREIHISGTEIPHPTLGHELAHVFLGEVSETLWGAPGIFGFIPNWGLSEGLATYLTPELNIREDLSTQEQAFALYRLGLEKNPEDLLVADLWSFWVQSSSRAYTASAAILGAYLDYQCHTQVCRAKLIRRLAKAGDIVLPNEFLRTYRSRMEQEALPPDALPSVARYYEPSSIIFADCSVVLSKDEKKTPEQEGDKLGLEKRFAEALSEYAKIPELELPIYQQRQLLVKKAFMKDTSYAVAGLELLVSKPRDLTQLGAIYGRLGASLAKPEQTDMAYEYAVYLLARTEILAGSFKFGLAWMPVNLDGLIGQESKRVLALARSQIGQAEQAAIDLEAIKNQATRPADKIRLGDMAQRARLIATGQNFLLGVWTINSRN
ncbi:MAG: hypothetical protein WCK49_08845 [Myxococcaceae bacterium]